MRRLIPAALCGLLLGLCGCHQSPPVATRPAALVHSVPPAPTAPVPIVLTRPAPPPTLPMQHPAAGNASQNANAVPETGPVSQEQFEQDKAKMASLIRQNEEMRQRDPSLPAMPYAADSANNIYSIAPDGSRHELTSHDLETPGLSDPAQNRYMAQMKQWSDQKNRDHENTGL